jgi:hypothetical protein
MSIGTVPERLAQTRGPPLGRAYSFVERQIIAADHHRHPAPVGLDFLNGEHPRRRRRPVMAFRRHSSG